MGLGHEVYGLLFQGVYVVCTIDWVKVGILRGDAD